MKIIEKNISEQKKGLYRKVGGGNEWRELGEKGKKQVLSDKEILELVKLVKKIEDHYGTPQDIEWAQDKSGKFYITQSRPITTLNGKKKEIKTTKDNLELFQKFMVRSFPLFFYELWYEGEKNGLPKICNNMMFFDPMFIYTNNKGAQVLYNITDEMQIPFILITYFNQHKNDLKKLAKKYLENYYKTVRYTNEKCSKEVSFKKEYALFSKMLPILTAMIIIGKTDNKHVDKGIIKISNETRQKAENFVGIVINKLLESAHELLPKEYKDHAYFLTHNEIISKKLPPIQEIKRRQQGYIYYDYKIFLKKDLNKFLGEYNYKIIKEKVGETRLIKGQIAYHGKKVGVVKKIFEVSQIKNVKKDSVLVASMTTPDLISAVKKACAIVTDEGGITCHAAIVSRELKKPCIIGTEIATQVLQDGDLVEVDADSGVVRIFER